MDKVIIELNKIKDNNPIIIQRKIQYMKNRNLVENIIKNFELFIKKDEIKEEKKG